MATVCPCPLSMRCKVFPRSERTGTARHVPEVTISQLVSSEHMLSAPHLDSLNHPAPLQPARVQVLTGRHRQPAQCPRRGNSRAAFHMKLPCPFFFRAPASYSQYSLTTPPETECLRYGSDFSSPGASLFMEQTVREQHTPAMLLPAAATLSPCRARKDRGAAQGGAQPEACSNSPPSHVECPCCKKGRLFQTRSLFLRR